MNILMYYLKYLKERRNNLNFYIMNSFVKGDSKFIPKTDGYNKNALIRKFIDEYRKKVKRKLKVRIFICVPELSTNGSFFNIDEKGRFLTFVIYLENVQQKNLVHNDTHEELEFKNLIRNLNDELKEIVILYYFEDFSIKEISKIIKIPEGTVKTRLSRARKKLEDTILNENKKKGDEKANG